MRALAIVLVLAATAHADELDDARALEANLAYEKALALIEAAIAHGNADSHRLAEMYLEAGKLAAGLDRALEAEDFFAHALAIDPTLALPEGTSPKITAPFYAARSRLPEPKPPPIENPIPPPPPKPNVEPVTPSRAWYARPALWGTVTALGATATALAAWRENVAQNDWNLLRNDPMPHDYSQLRTLEDRGRTWALAANIGLGLTGVAAIATGVTLLVTPDSVGVAGRF